MIPHDDRVTLSPGEYFLEDLGGGRVRLTRDDNPISEGTPINKAKLDEFLAASGTTAGTSTALTLAQTGFTLFDGALVRFKLHTDIGAGATLNVNGTGAYQIKDDRQITNVAKAKSGSWMTCIYSPGKGWIAQGITPDFLLTGNISVQTGTISHGATIPQTPGYTNYAYFISPNSGTVTEDLVARWVTPDKDFRTGIRCYLTGRVVTAQLTLAWNTTYDPYNGGWQWVTTAEGITANYMEIAWR